MSGASGKSKKSRKRHISRHSKRLKTSKPVSPPRVKLPRAKNGVITATPEQITAFRNQQKRDEKLARERRNAELARDAYKPRKKDLGKMLMIGFHGQKDPHKKGRVGYLIYVTKTGKKQLLKQGGMRKREYQPRKLKDTEAPIRKNLKRAIEQFHKTRLVLLKDGSGALRGKGNVKTGGPYEFGDEVVEKIARSIQKALKSQASNRNFLISVKGLFKRKGESQSEAFEFSVPIDKPDHILIHIEGMANFVARKFYAFMAKSLAFLGVVTNGSANHVRYLPDNQGLPIDEWTQDDGDNWRGAESEVVTLTHLDWRIEQGQ